MLLTGILVITGENLHVTVSTDIQKQVTGRPESASQESSEAREQAPGLGKHKAGQGFQTGQAHLGDVWDGFM